MSRTSSRLLALSVCVVCAAQAWAASGAAPEPPPDAPSVKAHVERAAEVVGDTPIVSGTAADGLSEVASLAFDAPFRPAVDLVALSDGQVYGFDHDDRLTAIDARTGRVVGRAFIGDYWSGGIAFVERPDGSRLAIRGAQSSRWSDPRARVFDVSDPSEPHERVAFETCGTRVQFAAEGALALNGGDGCTQLVDVETGERLFDFGSRIRSIVDRPFGAGTRFFVIVDRYGPHDELRAWDFTATVPVLRQIAPVDRGARVLVDRRGDVVVVDGVGGGIAVLDPWDLRTLATIGTEADLRHAAFVEGGGERILAVSTDASVELYDLGDPFAPRTIGTVDVDFSRYYWFASYDRLVASPDRPWLLALPDSRRGFVVIDAVSAEVVGRYDDPKGKPYAAVWTTLDDGTPAVGWAAERSIGEFGPVPEGGIAVFDTVSLADPGAPERVRRHDPVTPGRIEAVLPVGGRFAVVIDRSANAFVSVDLATSEVVDAVGSSGMTFVRYPSTDVAATVSGRTVAVASRDGVQLFDVDLGDGGLLARGYVARSEARGEPLGLHAGYDGAVVVMWSKAKLTTHLPDGRSGEVDVPIAARSVSISPDGRLAAGAWGSIWIPSDAPSFVVDLEDPAHPRLLWTRNDGAVFATFVRGGERLALTKRVGWRYAPYLYDPWTGELRGEPLDAASPWFYYAPTTAFGHGARSRLLYWQWTFSAWESTVFDVGTDRPTLVGTSGIYGGDPDALPRDDGVSAYELRGVTYLVHPDGRFERFDDHPMTGARRLRHGFLVGHERLPDLGPLGLTVRRDRALNRPPVARAGGDRALECAGPSGTRAVLDARGSTDPDSTPGTQDDLARFAWRIDDRPAGDVPVVEVELALGPHRAALSVTDVVGASGRAEASVDVVDTRPPEVAVSLAPVFAGDRAWAFDWAVDATAVDRCEGALVPRTRLWLDPSLRDADAAAVPGEGEATVEVFERRGERSVVVSGPDPEAALAAWLRALEAGGLELAEATVRLVLEAPTPRGAADAVARYRIDAHGRLLEAVRFDGGDQVVVAFARDGAGHAAWAHASLREAIAAACRQLPANAACSGR